MSQPDPVPNTLPTAGAIPPTRDTTGSVTPDTRVLDGDPVAPELPAAIPPGRYEVLRFHAKGGMGEVSVALDHELQREVAYKQIQSPFAGNAESRRRFILEAEVTGRLEHPGIVPIYGLGVGWDGRPYYAMRFIQGDSLRDAIAAFHAAETPGRDVGERELALRGLLRRFVDVCNAVAFAHDRGWLHRDLKPANVMLGKFGETLVVDWGLARLLRSNNAEEPGGSAPASGAATLETKQGQIVGTPPYMSPEQANGDWQAVDVRSDVYSLGAVLYELLTGQVPFAGTVQEVLEAVRAGALVPPRRRQATVPTALEAVVMKAMTLHPEQRYATALDLAAEVERWLADEPVRAYRESLPQRVRRWGRRHRLLVTGLTVLLVTASIGLSVGLVLIQRAWNETQLALEQVNKEKHEKEVALASAQSLARNGLNIVNTVTFQLNRGLAPHSQMHELRAELLSAADEGLQKIVKEVHLTGFPLREQLAIHLELGALFLYMDKRGVESARQQFERAHVLARQLADRAPGNPQAVRDLSVALGRLGDVRLLLGNTKAALDYYQQALTFRQQLLEADPTSAEAQRDVAVAWTKLGNVRLVLGDIRAARDAYEQSKGFLRQSAEADPNNAEYQRDLAVTLNKLSTVYLRSGDTKRAKESQLESIAISKRLAEAAPQTVQAQRDLAIAHERLGSMHLQMGQTGEALAAYQNYREACKRLAELEPSNSQAQRDLSLALNRIGTVRLRLGDTQGAVTAYEEALVIGKRLADAEPTNTRAQRDLIVWLNVLGSLRLQSGNARVALEVFQDSHLRCMRLAEADEKNAEAQRDLAIAHERLGDAHLELNNPRAALAAYQQYRALCQRRAAAAPEDVQGRCDLSVSLEKLSEVQLRLGDKQAALAAGQESFALRQRLAADDPKNVQAQRDLAVALDRVGAVRLELKDVKAAEAAYQQSVQIRLPLARNDPRNAQAQRDLLVGYSNLGDVQLAQRDYIAAASWYEKGLEVARRYSRPDTFKSDVAFLVGQLQLCQAANKALVDPTTTQQLAVPLRFKVLDSILPLLAQGKERDKVLTVGELFAKEAKNAGALYRAGCAFAACIPLSDQADDKEKHGARAVALLQQAIAAGFKDRDLLDKERLFDPLRQRADFQKLLQSLPEKPAP